jgi:hypothetical protein
VGLEHTGVRDGPMSPDDWCNGGGWVGWRYARQNGHAVSRNIAEYAMLEGGGGSDCRGHEHDLGEGSGWRCRGFL